MFRGGLYPWTQTGAHIKWCHIQSSLEGLDLDVLVLLDSGCPDWIFSPPQLHSTKSRMEIICAISRMETTLAPAQFYSSNKRWMETFKVRSDITTVVIEELEFRSHQEAPFTAGSLYLGVVRRILADTLAGRYSDPFDKLPPPTPAHFFVEGDATLAGIILKPLRKASSPPTQSSLSTDRRLPRSGRLNRLEEYIKCAGGSLEEEDEKELMEVISPHQVT
jgi:hypothetical protein